MARRLNIEIAIDSRKAKAGGKEAGDALNDVAHAAKRAASDYDRLARSIDPAYKASAELKDATKTLNQALKTGAITQDQYNTRLRQAQMHFRTSTTGIDQMRTAVRGVTAALAAFGVSRLVSEMLQLSKASVVAALDLERVQRVLSPEEFGFVRAEVDRLGLDLAATAKSYAALSAAAKGTALEGKDSERIFSSVAGAMRALGRTSAETEGALNAIQQMISKGNVQAEELRGQLGERLPGAFGLAAEAMGVTTQELNKMLDNGQVLASELLPNLADALENRFGAKAMEASEGAEAGMARVRTAVFELQAAFGSGLTPAVGEAADELARLGGDQQTIETVRNLGVGVGILASALVNLASAASESQTMMFLLGAAFRDVARHVPGLNSLMNAYIKALLDHNAAAAQAVALQQSLSIRQAGMNTGGDVVDPRAIDAEAAARGLVKLAAVMTDVQKKTQSLREEWETAEGQALALAAAADQGRPVYERLKTYFDALNKVVAAGVDPASKLGQEMIALGEAAAAAQDKVAQTLRRSELKASIEDLRQLVALQRELLGVIEGRDVGALPTIDYGVLSEAGQKALDEMVNDLLPQLTEEYGETLAGLTENIAANLTEGVQRALADGLSEFFRTGKADFEDFFRTVGDLAADVLGEALAARLTKVLEKNLSEGGLADLFKGGTGTALALGITASNIANAEDQGYAAAGAVIGAALGAYIGSIVPVLGTALGAQWGAVLGSAIGGAIKHGAPRFYGELEAVAGELNLAGELARVGGTMAADIKAGMEQILSVLGGELEGLGATIGLEMREGLAVTVDGIRTYFDSEHIGEGIQFAIVEALKNADISGISSEARAALQNTMADTMEELLSDLDFARWIEQLDLTASAKALDDFVDEFRVAWDRMVKLGIDGADKLAQWAAKSLEDQRRSILGIQETARERITREAASFNAQLQLIRAEQEAKRAELTIQRAQLEANVSFLQAYGDIVGQRLELDGLLLKGERNLLQGKLGMLEAIDAALAAVDALLGSLPDLISNADIRKAINRAGRGAGGPTGPTQADRDAALTGMQDFGLSDAARQLAAATRFVDEHMQSVAELGFSEEQLMEIRRKAQAEQDKLIRDLGRGELAALGTTSVATIQRMQDLGLQLKFLRENAEALGLTLPQVNAAARELSEEITLSIAGGLAQYIDDADVRRQLQILEHDLFMRQKAIEIQAAYTMGAITQQQLEFLQGMLDMAKDWKPPEIAPVQRFNRTVTRTFSDARRDAERIAESFARAKGSVAGFLNEVLRGEFGGVSPVGGVLEAQRQYDEVLAQAQSGNIGAIGQLGDFGATLLRVARDTFASGPEFQAIRDYVLASGVDILALKQGREGNVVFDERFFSQGQAQLSETQKMHQTMQEIRDFLRGQASRPQKGAA